MAVLHRPKLHISGHVGKHFLFDGDRVAPPPRSPGQMGAVLAILLLAQTAAAPPPTEVVSPTDATRFDLAKYRPREGKCTDSYPLGDDVLVCARMADIPKSLAEQAAVFEPRPFRPAWKIPGGEGGVGPEQRSTITGSAPT